MSEDAPCRDAIDPVAVRRAAMDLLARREHARGELQTKLLRRFPGDPALIAGQIQRLAEDGLQSDARMAEVFVRSRLGRGHGPLRIRQDLRRRGISDDDVALAIAEAAIDWAELAVDTVIRKFGEAPPGDHKERARQGRFLQQRGFDYETIRIALARGTI